MIIVGDSVVFHMTNRTTPECPHTTTPRRATVASVHAVDPDDPDGPLCLELEVEMTEVDLAQGYSPTQSCSPEARTSPPPSGSWTRTS